MLETVTVMGRNVYVSRCPGADLVVLVRLASREGGVWNGLWQRLQGRYTLANIDLGSPGQAESSAGEIFKDFAHIVVDIAKTLEPRPFHIVGWTGGTQIALQAALRHSERLASMTLITPFREVGDRRRLDRGLDFIETILRSGDRERYAYYWFMAGLSNEFLTKRFDEVERLVATRLAGDPFVALDVDRAMAWMRALRSDWVSSAELAEIKLPTLILGASENHWHAGPAPEMAEALHRAISGSAFEIFAGLGPLLLLEAPDTVADTIDRFLRIHPVSNSARNDKKT